MCSLTKLYENNTYTFKQSTYRFSYHGGVGVRGKQLHVDHPVDGSLAVAVVVLTYLGLHFGWRFLQLFLNKNGTKIELYGGFVSSVQVSEVSV